MSFSLDQHRAAGSIVSRWTVTILNSTGSRVPLFGTSIAHSRAHKHHASEMMRDLFRGEDYRPLHDALTREDLNSIRVEKLDYWRGYHALEVQG